MMCTVAQVAHADERCVEAELGGAVLCAAERSEWAGKRLRVLL